MWQKMLQVGSGGGESAKSPTLIFRRFVLTPSASKKTIGTVDGKIKCVIAILLYNSTREMRYLFDAENNIRYRWYSNGDAYQFISEENMNNQTFFISEDKKSVEVLARDAGYQKSTEYLVIYESEV